MITVLTASVPQRGAFLAEAVESVTNQTYMPEAHLIGVDHMRHGAAQVYNQLSESVKTEWMTFLDDDDVMDPDHLETMVKQFSDEVDVVYTKCRSVGHRTFVQYDEPFDAQRLQVHSIVPVTASVRTDLYRKVEGMRTEWGYDWELWKRISLAGARFKQIDKVTWTYRFHGHNQSAEGVD